MNLSLDFFAPAPGRLPRKERKAAAAPAVAEVPPAGWTIGKGCIVAFRQPAGMTVSCAHGCLWITHDGELRDVVISSGETYASDSASRMLVYGVEASCATVA